MWERGREVKQGVRGPGRDGLDGQGWPGERRRQVGMGPAPELCIRKLGLGLLAVCDGGHIDIHHRSRTVWWLWYRLWSPAMWL